MKKDEMKEEERMNEIMSELKNPQFTVIQLEELQVKVDNNKATVDDYERLDKFLQLRGLDDFVSRKIHLYGLNDIRDYKKKRDLGYPFPEITGSILGVISAIKKFI